MIRIAIWLVLLADVQSAAGQNGPIAQEIAAVLNNELRDKIVTLKMFYPGEEVRFTADGGYTGREKMGSWTLWSKLQVNAVEMTAKGLQLKGRRFHVAYDSKRGQFKNVESKEKLSITVEFDVLPITLGSARAALGKILLTGNERLSTFVPEEWQRILKVEEDGPLHSLPSAEQREGIHEPFKITKGGITAPRVLSAPDPEYQKEAEKAKFQGTVVLWAIVGEDGRISDVHISRPLGMGLDEKAIEALRKWLFEPAKKGGVPVRSQINIEVNFRLW